MAEYPHILFNPVERTLYRLFMNHLEGLRADDLVLHWKELCSYYSEESLYDDPVLREEKMASLCAESKTVFYSTVSRIKSKLKAALGAREARKYYIQRNKAGLYRIRHPYPISTTVGHEIIG